MSDLTTQERAILDALATAIVGGDGACISGQELNRRCGQRDPDIIAYLARRVEEMTDRQHTLRSADKHLFRLTSGDRIIYLVLCPYDTPSGRVDELSDGMILLHVQTEVACRVIYNTAPASEEQVTSRRRQSQASLESSERAAAKTHAIKADVAKCLTTFQDLVRTHAQREGACGVVDQLDSSETEISLELLAEMCHSMGTRLHQVMSGI